MPVPSSASSASAKQPSASSASHSALVEGGGAADVGGHAVAVLEQQAQVHAPACLAAVARLLHQPGPRGGVRFHAVARDRRRAQQRARAGEPVPARLLENGLARRQLVRERADFAQHREPDQHPPHPICQRTPVRSLLAIGFPWPCLRRRQRRR
jgi:hypothetical protein